MTKKEAIKVVKLLKTLTDIGDASIILNTFISAFETKHIVDESGKICLPGNFNLGGTKTGRLSSSNPNLQNIPSNSIHAKLIKECFQGKGEWLMVGADFDSLEDKISALTTRDPNKLKAYEDGYDGHCLRAFYYYRDEMPDIIDTVDSINSIETKYPEKRQDSKEPTFALTYKGTWHTLVNKAGIPEDTAKRIEANYHKLYKVADDWVNARIKKASKTGYVTGAFGLRLRTPVLSQVVYGSSFVPYEARKEERTAGNMLGQSWGMLNNRAGIELQERLFKSKHIYDIKPIAHIHDAQYFLVKRDPEVIKWLNDNLVECMQWQDLPEIQHPVVKLGGSLEIYYPSWANPTKINNNASEDIIRMTLYKLYKGIEYGVLL